jgi:hypothetical protein
MSSNLSTMEKAWMYFLMGVLATLLGILVHHILSPKHVVRYELGGRYSEGIPTINVDIENSQDETIQLSKDVTWEAAVKMVDSLNINLSKHPIK